MIFYPSLTDCFRAQQLTNRQVLPIPRVDAICVGSRIISLGPLVRRQIVPLDGEVRAYLMVASQWTSGSLYIQSHLFWALLIVASNVHFVDSLLQPPATYPRCWLWVRYIDLLCICKWESVHMRMQFVARLMKRSIYFEQVELRWMSSVNKPENALVTCQKLEVLYTNPNPPLQSPWRIVGLYICIYALGATCPPLGYRHSRTRSKTFSDM
jgi:hypothetical protein